jgi:diadenosine tetraphosphate (Ap4A) HIT family hydrolase
VLERLWNGWRSTYVSSVPPPGDGRVEGASSVFTEILRSGLPDDETHIVHRGESVFAILNAYPYATAHTLVLPYREVPDLEDLTPAEHAELWATVTDAVRAIKRAYRPEGLNVGLNLGRPAGGSVAEHVHVHVVPRWIGDSNFMTATANTRTIPEALPTTAARLRAAWPASGGPTTRPASGGPTTRPAHLA